MNLKENEYYFEEIKEKELYLKENNCKNCGSKNIKLIYSYSEKMYDEIISWKEFYYDIYCNDCKYTKRNFNLTNWFKEHLQEYWKYKEDRYRKIKERAINIFRIRKERKKT